MFTLFLASGITTTMTFDWGAIATAMAPVITIIVTWYLQRRSTRNEANRVAAITIATASKVAEIHKDDTASLQESVGAVHSLVNGKNAALVQRVAELEAENRTLKGK
jgi:hypothetical protein